MEEKIIKNKRGPLAPSTHTHKWGEEESTVLINVENETKETDENSRETRFDFKNKNILNQAYNIFTVNKEDNTFEVTKKYMGEAEYTPRRTLKADKQLEIRIQDPEAFEQLPKEIIYQELKPRKVPEAASNYVSHTHTNYQQNKQDWLNYNINKFKIESQEEPEEEPAELYTITELRAQQAEEIKSLNYNNSEKQDLVSKILDDKIVDLLQGLNKLSSENDKLFKLCFSEVEEFNEDVMNLDIYKNHFECINQLKEMSRNISGMINKKQNKFISQCVGNLFTESIMEDSHARMQSIIDFIHDYDEEKDKEFSTVKPDNDDIAIIASKATSFDGEIKRIYPEEEVLKNHD